MAQSGVGWGWRQEEKRDENHFQDEWIILGRECKKEREEVEQKREGKGEGEREECYTISNEPLLQAVTCIMSPEAPNLELIFTEKRGNKSPMSQFERVQLA